MKLISALALCIPLFANAMSKEEQIWKAVKDNDKALLVSALDGAKDVVPGMRDQVGRTPLHYCARQQHAQLIPLLMAAGANINDCQNIWHTTPLIEAVHAAPCAAQEHAATVKALLPYNPDLTIKDSQDRTAEIVASLYYREPIWVLLNAYAEKIRSAK
ncbi:hypothetical protein BH09DEP1_BH09DEP1_6220 [soil metagenome]